MKKSWIILLVLITEFIFVIGGVLGEEIQLTYPENVNVGEEFDITLTLDNFTEDVYDIKIEILNGTHNIAQRFWQDEWKSTYNWIYAAINTSKSNNQTFLVKIIENYHGVNDITIKTRKTDTTNPTEYGPYQINISLSEENNKNNNGGNEEEPEIYLEIDWNDEDIINGQEFEVEIKAFNLRDGSYDLKIWIEFKENDTVISDRYGEDSKGDEKWLSGTRYIYDLFSGSGDETEDVKLRIREDYKDFYGRAKIFFKIEGEEENDKYIDILEREADEEDENIPEVLESIQTAPITGSVIKLGTSEISTETEDIKTQDNIVYESKTELIKKYAIYGFALLCVVVCVLLGFKRLK